MITPNITLFLAVALPAVAYVRVGGRSESPGGRGGGVGGGGTSIMVGIISPRLVGITHYCFRIF